MKIITITLNPSLDKTVQLNELQVGELNRVQSVVEHAAGKGINITKSCNLWGFESIALGFIGGYIGSRMNQLLNSENVKTDFVNIDGNTRTNLKVRTDDGLLTEINEPGPYVSNTNIDELKDKIRKYADKDCVVVLSGSAPASLSPTTYREIIELAKEQGSYVVLDADNEALKEGLKATPHLIKPNEKEVQWFLGSADVLSEKQLIQQAKQWINQGVETVIISRGAQGALFVNKEYVYQSNALRVNLASPIGAGDSMVAAMVCAKLQNMTFAESSKFAIAASAATVEMSGTQPASLEMIESKIKKVVLKEIK